MDASTKTRAWRNLRTVRLGAYLLHPAACGNERADGTDGERKSCFLGRLHAAPKGFEAHAARHYVKAFQCRLQSRPEVTVERCALWLSQQ